jgi:multiple sugar transport system substrate-binding protein
MSDRMRRSPSPRAVGFPVMDRRSFVLTGVGGLAAAYGLSACGGDDDDGGGGGESKAPEKASGTVTFGSNYSDAQPKKALAAVLAAFEAESGVQVKIKTTDHEAFQEQINKYLQARPDDVFAWFAGYRMQFFAQRGLVGDISDVWEGELTQQMSKALKDQSTGLDGKQYFVPQYYYPWAVFYRKSVFEKNGYEPPKTFDEFKALLAKAQKDGLIPLAFAIKEGWPPMGTFDYLNMRHNGYEFHKNLMAGKEPWDSPQVKQVFESWREIMPYHQKGAAGRDWMDSAKALGRGDAAMMLLGAFIGQAFQDKKIYEDIDFFAFPEINPEHGQQAVEAPIDGFMMSKEPKNEAAAKALLRFMGTPKAAETYLESDPNNIAANKTAKTTGYNHLQRKSVEIINQAKQISQYLDRDTRPDFSSTVMIPAFQQFYNKPDDIDGLVKKIEQQKKTIFI